jgi:nitrate reductase assembly molybdenum cofactor insertion protein NarJ
MKILVHNNHNRAEEVITRAEEELALAKLIQHGADRDLMQVQKIIEDLSQKLAVSDQRFATLWKSFKTFAKLLRTSEDDGRT